MLTLGGEALGASKTRLIAGLRLAGKVLEVGFARGVRHSRRGGVHLSISALLALACCLATTSPALAEFSSVPDDTAETDGRVSTIVVAGDRIYLGGSFTHVDGVPRGGLAAIDATTGRLTGWNPGTDGRVLALAMSADGSRLYVGGDFDSVGGLTRNSMAAVDPVTGVVEKQWRVSTNGTVRALALRGDRLYLGGSFLTVKGLARERLAVVDATTGEPDANWMPSADSHVRTLAPSPDGDRVYIGGEFSLVSGQSRQHLAALDAATGALLADWHPNPPDYVHDLAASGTHVYVGGEGNAAEAFDAARSCT
jgi:trimeric autotransporter adhesin